VSILILEHASLYHASSSRPALDKALDRAYSQYKESNIHNIVKEHFFASHGTYLPSQFMEFILEYRLR
jgi:hypothetical protein